MLSDRVDQALAETYAAGFLVDDDGERRSLEPTAVEPAQGRAIRRLVAAEGARRTFEVGFALGLSTLHIVAGLLEGGGEGVAHVAIDPTEGPHWRNAGLRLVERAGLADRVELIEQESQLALPRLVEEGQLFDIAFIDGDHRFDPALIDIYFALRLVRTGGLVIVDDMWMPAVRTAVAFFVENVGLELEPEALEDGFRWTRRGSGPRPGRGSTAVLRKPSNHVERPWDHFVEFW